MGAVPGDLASYRVLIVDDVEVNRLIAIDLLNRIGVQSAEATNGREAIDAVRSIRFDLILMDVQMPIMDGFAASEAIRALPAPTGDIPIVALTAGSVGGMERCAMAGMDDYLPKPITIETFTATVLKWLPTPEG
jgi:CheY-like chemotaxis protein